VCGPVGKSPTPQTIGDDGDAAVHVGPLEGDRSCNRRRRGTIGPAPGGPLPDPVSRTDVTILDTPGVLVQVSMPPPSFMAASLDVAPVAELVGLLVRQRLTGRLDVVSSGGTRSLYFEGGSYTGSTSAFTADRFGEVLWRIGRLSLDKLVIASEYVKQEQGKLFGRALVELGFLDATDLRACLVEQALAVFQAACLEEKGSLAFIKDSYHRSPLRFGISTPDMVDKALLEATAHRTVIARLGRLDRAFAVGKAGGLMPQRPGQADVAFTTAPHTSTLDEAEQAIIQLAMSAKEARTGLELIQGSGLGRQDGAQALLRLVEKGRLIPKALPADQETRLRRLCQAVSLAMDALDEAGFGVAEQVRELVENPPTHLEEALSGLTLRDPLVADVVVEQAQFLPGGLIEMGDALQAVLDEALQQADDMLPPELTAQIQRRITALLTPAS